MEMTLGLGLVEMCCCHSKPRCPMGSASVFVYAIHGSFMPAAQCCYSVGADRLAALLYQGQ